MRPRPAITGGPGVRVNQMPGGAIVSFDGDRSLWLHPFRVTMLGATAARVRVGLVNGLVPLIGDIPLDAPAPPVLAWQRTKLDDDGRGWIALEATLGKKWEVLSAKIVQVASLDTDDGEAAPPAADDATPAYRGGGTLTLSGRRARHPLALLRRRPNGQLVRFQVTHFDLQHRAFELEGAAPSAPRARHFFFAAS